MTLTWLPTQLPFQVPPFTVPDARPEKVLRLLETFFPHTHLTIELRHQASPDAQKQPQLVPIPDRERWLSESQRGERAGTITSGVDEPVVSVDFEFDATIRTQAGETELPVVIWMPADEPSKPGFTARVGQCGDALKAWHMAWMPAGILPSLFHRQPLPLRSGGPDLSALPRLARGKVPSAQLPIEIGWVNYWSARTAELLGFPDRSRDQEWLANAVSTASGGWVVQLTPERFDGERQEHIDALVRAYQRFDQIGVRR